MLWKRQQARRDGGAAIENAHQHQKRSTGTEESVWKLLRPPFWGFNRGASADVGLNKQKSMRENDGGGALRKPSRPRRKQDIHLKPTSSTPLDMDGSGVQLSPQTAVMMVGVVLVGAWLARWAFHKVISTMEQRKRANADEVAAAAARDNSKEEIRRLDDCEVRLDHDRRAASKLEGQVREAERRAEEAERRAADVRSSHRREVALLEDDVEMSRILNGRLQGQLKAERKVSGIRQQGLKASQAEAKERADKAEAHLAALQGYLEEEKVKSKKLAAEIADKTRAEEELQAASREPKGPVENDGRESAGVVGHAGWKEDMRKGMCTTVAEENSGESLRLDSPATTGPGVGVVGKEGARHAETLIAAGNAGGARSEEERHASSASWSAHGVNGQAGGREAPNIAELIGEAGESKPVLTKLRRMFLKRVRKAGDDMESSPAMQLALHCPLSPTSPCLMRDDVLGKGRYGTVTRVLHKFGLFALKEVSADADEGAIPAARREMDVIVRLGFHPNFIAVKALDDTIPTMPILMEVAYCDYFVVLADNDENFSTLKKINLLRDAGQGLNHMANNGLVHVDIKPDNLLVVKTADGLVGKMADYGHTRGVGDYRDSMTGTDGFVAMENLFEGVLAATDQDVFALAVLVLMSFVQPEFLENNMFASKCLLNQEENTLLEDILDLEDSMYERHVFALHCQVMARTTGDGSFYREIVVPEKLQETVPSPQKVCEWLKACLSTDPSARPTMGELVSNLNDLAEEAKNMLPPV